MDPPSSSSTTQLSEVPAALLCKILQLVPQTQRLSCCALVCSAWRSAAAQATVRIDCELRAESLGAFVAWLKQHAQQVQSLELRFCSDPDLRLWLQLAWHRLVQLETLSLTGMKLAPITSAGGSSNGGSSSGGSTSPPRVLLPCLKHLQLSRCGMDSADSWVQLASSPGLTSLVVDKECAFNAGAGQQQVSAALGTLLQRLSQLVVLRLPNAWQSGPLCLSGAAVKHVAAMRSLQDLQLSIVKGGCLADLPSFLTSLRLRDDRERPLQVVQPTLPPQLQQLTSLQHLQLLRCSFVPAALASMAQLQHLHVEECILLPCTRDARANTAAASAALLGALQQLMRLQHLDLRRMCLCTEAGLPQQRAALTASTQLTHIFLLEDEAQPLSQSAAQHMFAAGRQLPHLQTLCLQLVFGQPDEEWCLDSQGLRSIISCCPQLQALSVAGTVRAGADVSALLQLPASCSSLTVGGDCFDDTAVPVLRQLTQLKELFWRDSSDLTDLGLQQLTALQGLSKLFVMRCWDISDSVLQASGGNEDDQIIQLVARAAKPVWQQLQAICDHSPECAAALRQQLAEKEEQVQQLQLQLQLAAREAELLPASRDGQR